MAGAVAKEKAKKKMAHGKAIKKKATQ